VPFLTGFGHNAGHNRLRQDDLLDLTGVGYVGYVWIYGPDARGPDCWLDE